MLAFIGNKFCIICILNQQKWYLLLINNFVKRHTFF